MLTISSALTAARAAQYYEAEYSRADYFSEHRTTPGDWMGAGSRLLELLGPVDDRRFTELLEGREPGSGALLVPPAASTGTHRAAWDLTFSAPKSVSLAALVGGDHRLIGAHEAAAREAFAAIEAYAQARASGGEVRVPTAALVAAGFRHHTSRSLDPQLHTHVVVMNMTRRPDGAWRALEPRELFRSQAFATAVYRSALAAEARALGYEVTVTRGGAWELRGITRTQLLAFSTRRQAITAYLTERGVEGARAAQIAAHQTRAAKAEIPDPLALRAGWGALAATRGLDLDRIVRAAHRSRPVTQRDRISPTVAVDFAIGHVTERTAVAERRALLRWALARGMGDIDLPRAQAEVERREADGRLIRATSAAGADRAYTTPELLRLEREILATIERGRDRFAPLGPAPPKHLLSPDQARAAHALLMSRDQVLALVGRAGTGKTQLLQHVREVAEARGYLVRGYTPTTRAAAELRAVGFEVTTVQALAAAPARDRYDRPRREFWVLDEASLVATRELHVTLRRARSVQARILLVGDPRQHESVGAGGLFRLLVERERLTVARTTAIKRQHDPELRRVVEHLALGRTHEALATLERRGAVREIPDRRERLLIAARAAAQGEGRTLVIAPGHAERRALNELIRAERLTDSRVGPGHEGSILVPRDLTAAERSVVRNYEIGDTVRFVAPSRRVGCERGELARVAAIDEARNLIVLRTRDGHERFFDPRYFRSVEVLRDELVTMGVNDRVQFRAADRTLGVANGTFGTIREVSTSHNRGTPQLTVEVKTDSGRRLHVDLAVYRRLDLGYAVTSHAAQGATVDRVIVMADTQQSRDLVNARQLYVSVSRARDEVVLFTDDHAALQQAVGRDVGHMTALEAVGPGLGESRALSGVDHHGPACAGDRDLAIEQDGASWER